jgi:hypothetical protein
VGCNLGPKGLGPKAFKSGTRSAWLLQCFRAPNDVVRDTTNELLNIAAQHASNEETAGVVLVLGDMDVNPGSSRAMPSNVTIQGAKGARKRRKRHPR